MNTRMSWVQYARLRQPPKVEPMPKPEPAPLPKSTVLDVLVAAARLNILSRLR